MILTTSPGIYTESEELGECNVKLHAGWIAVHAGDRAIVFSEDEVGSIGAIKFSNGDILRIMLEKAPPPE